MHAEAKWQDMLDDPGAQDHLVQFYQDDDFLRESVCRFLHAGLRQGETAIAIVTEPHWRMYSQALEAAGCDVHRLTQAGRLLFLDARQTLDQFLVIGAPDREAFWKLLGEVMRRARANSARPRVRAYGEMVNLLWLEGNFAAAIRLEELWNELAQVHPFTLFCTYYLDPFDTQAASSTAGILHTHSHFIPVADFQRLKAAVQCAMNEVLGSIMARNIDRVIRARDGNGNGSAKMPAGQQALQWIAQNLPQQAAEIAGRARQHYHYETPPAHV